MLTADLTRQFLTEFECGVTVAGHEDVREGDVIESYEIVEEKRTLELE